MYVHFMAPGAHTGSFCCFLVHIQGVSVVSWYTYRALLLFPYAADFSHQKPASGGTSRDVFVYMIRVDAVVSELVSEGY